MSFSDGDPSAIEFRPEFVDGIVAFFDGQYDGLSQKERAHAIGVIANTLASLAMNQTRAMDAKSMGITLDTLSDASNATVEALVNDESASYLFPQSLRICEIIRDAIVERKGE
ncbi:hypothetical protein KC947_01070 [Candidatus Saccharibacteria bacterium]|nr:hypothetical protein [Candidatus Saccharibacteria bacterium]